MIEHKYRYAMEIVGKLSVDVMPLVYCPVGEIIGEHPNAAKKARCGFCDEVGMARYNARRKVLVGLDCCRKKTPGQLIRVGIVRCAKCIRKKVQGRSQQDYNKAWGICDHCISQTVEQSGIREMIAVVDEVHALAVQTVSDKNYYIKTSIYSKKVLEIPYTIENEKYEYAREIVGQLRKTISIKFEEKPKWRPKYKLAILKMLSTALKKIDAENGVIKKRHEENRLKASVYIEAGIEEPFAIAIINGVDEDEVLALWEADWRRQYENDDILLVAVLQGHLSLEQAQWINTVRSDNERLALTCIEKPNMIEWAKQLVECGFDKSPEAVEDILDGATPKIIARIRGVDVNYDIFPPALPKPLPSRMHKRHPLHGFAEKMNNIRQVANFITFSKQLSELEMLFRGRWDGNEQ